MAAHIQNTSIQEAKAGGSCITGHPELNRETLSDKEGQRDGSMVKSPVTKPEDLSLISSTQMVERTDSGKLMCAQYTHTPLKKI